MENENKIPRLQDYFENENAPEKIPVQKVEKAEKVGDYMLTVCEMAYDRMACYFLIKLERCDKSSLPAGNLSAAPKNYSEILTDINFDYGIYYYGKNGLMAYISTSYSDRIQNAGDDKTAYFVLGGDMEIKDLNGNTDRVELTVFGADLFNPYCGAPNDITETERLFDEQKEFTVEAQMQMPFEKKNLDDGEECGISSFGLYKYSGLSADELSDMVTWKIKFKNGSVMRSGDYSLIASSRVSPNGIFYINWYGDCIDIYSVTSVTINGVEYEW